MKINNISLLVYWLGLSTSTAVGTSSIPGWRTKILHAEWYGQKIMEIKKKSTLIDTGTLQYTLLLCPSHEGPTAILYWAYSHQFQN